MRASSGSNSWRAPRPSCRWGLRTPFAWTATTRGCSYSVRRQGSSEWFETGQSGLQSRHCHRARHRGPRPSNSKNSLEPTVKSMLARRFCPTTDFARRSANDLVRQSVVGLGPAHLDAGSGQCAGPDAIHCDCPSGSRAASTPEWRRNSRCRSLGSLGGSATVCLRGWTPFRPVRQSDSRTKAR